MSKFIDRTNEVNYNKQGEKMTIIRYSKLEGQRQATVDIQFEDGVIVYNREYANFKNGRIKHPIRYEESFAYHIKVELGIDLDDIWNWEKNNELGINPYEIYKCSKKKVWLYCQENDYHNYDKESNKVGYEISCANFNKGRRCSYCNIRKKIHYKDSLAYKYPQIAKMIAIKENNLTFDDCYNIGCSSRKKFYFKCLECDMISTKKHSLNEINNKGYYSCGYCSDGISIPNKFMTNILNQLNIKFEPEYSPYYFRNSQHVDFLLIDYNIIIEMDGNYGNHTKEYDYWRDFLNMKYGGYKTIRIKLFDNNKYSNDTLNYIKEQIIKSELSNIFDLNNISWEMIWEQCQNSLCIKTWELWNSDIHDIIKISEELKLSPGTVYKYLKYGAKLKKCNYTKEESLKVGHKKCIGGNNVSSVKIICITTGKQFDAISDGARYYNIKHSGHISDCCKGKRNFCGKLEDGTPLKWMYYEDYLKNK